MKNFHKSKIIEQHLANKQLLIDRGFLATFIDVDDVHVKRREDED